MSWRVVRSLLTLRDQINAMYPGRNKASDGTIGNRKHQLEVSEHNPDDDVDGDGIGEGPAVDDVVRALDITHDPSHGCDIGVITDRLAESRDPRIDYVIANGLIMSGSGGPYPWEWRIYYGDDPHTNHFHISVVKSPIADDPSKWDIGSGEEVSNMILMKGNGPTIIFIANGLVTLPSWPDCQALISVGVPLINVSDAFLNQFKITS